MNLFFVTFWTVMLFLSIGWYALLVFIIGAKAGREIKEMTRTLREQQEGSTEANEANRGRGS